jgi:hypothetical protein
VERRGGGAGRRAEVRGPQRPLRRSTILMLPFKPHKIHQPPRTSIPTHATSLPLAPILTHTPRIKTTQARGGPARAPLTPGGGHRRRHRRRRRAHGRRRRPPRGAVRVRGRAGLRRRPDHRAVRGAAAALRRREEEEGGDGRRDGGVYGGNQRVPAAARAADGRADGELCFLGWGGAGSWLARADVWCNAGLCGFERRAPAANNGERPIVSPSFEPQSLVPVVAGASDHPAIATELRQQLEGLQTVVDALAERWDTVLKSMEIEKDRSCFVCLLRSH